MLRNITEEVVRQGTVDVHLLDGTSYIGCDYPTGLLSEKEMFVSFWSKGRLYQVPTTLVKCFIFNPPE